MLAMQGSCVRHACGVSYHSRAPRSRPLVRAAAEDQPHEASGRRRAVLAGGALLGGLLLPRVGGGGAASAAGAGSTSSIYDLSAAMEERDVALSKYRGQVVLVVNVASA